ncbi:MAG: tRNA (adenosine(37)-N6)-threonylcarbamoyltransferase complex dimerization subunit type 1 TsaB [Burkholderiaceae bacterium]
MSTENLTAPPPLRLLAIETSTDRMSVALGEAQPGGVLLSHDGPGAAQSSLHLLPTVERLLDQAGWSLGGLDAIVFGRGPGSFTGLRTACAVTQGLAYGARAQGLAEGVPVLPVDTLLAVAEEARWRYADAGHDLPPAVVALLDARMGEVYVAVYALRQGRVDPKALLAPSLCAPGALEDLLRSVDGLDCAAALWAGNVFEAYAEALAGLPSRRQVAWPTATALLRLAPDLLGAGLAVSAHEAMPLYVRDKVAQTTDERERLRLAQQTGSVA